MRVNNKQCIEMRARNNLAEAMIVLGNIVIPNSSNRIPNSIFHMFYSLHIQDKVYGYFSGIRISINEVTEISIIVSLTTLEQTVRWPLHRLKKRIVNLRPNDRYSCFNESLILIIRIPRSYDQVHSRGKKNSNDVTLRKTDAEKLEVASTDL